MTSTSLVRQLGALFEGGSAAGLSDRQLLERFVAGHDPAGEAAFAALVARHGPMVLGICRQLLGDHQHAEDAFQAVFLVLARKARSIREPELLGNWLYGVALRTARKARGRLARRRRTEVEGSARYSAMPRRRVRRSGVTRPRAGRGAARRDRSPARAFRLPVVLCYFEGLSHDEAARRLQWPVGTVRSRLARARDKLRPGLARRGSRRAGGRGWRRPGAAIRLGVRLIPPVRFHHPGRDRFRGPSCRRRRGALRPDRGAGPGGHEIHVDPQAQTHRDVPVAPGGRRHRGGLAHPLDGDAGGPGEPPGGPVARCGSSGADRPGPIRAAPARMTRRRPRARSRRQAGQRRGRGRGRPAAHAAGRRQRRAATTTRCWARAGPTPTAAIGSTRPRTASTRVIRGPRDGRRARVRARLGRAEPRRRAARRRDQAPARAGRPRPAGRCDRRAGEGRRGARRGVWRPNANDEGRADGVSVGANPPEGLRTWPRPEDRRPGADRRCPASAAASMSTSGCATSATPARSLVHRCRPGDRGPGDDPCAAAGPAHRGPRPDRRHRVAHPQRHRLGHDPGQERERPRHLPHQASAPTPRGGSRSTRSPASSYTLTAFPTGGEPYLPGRSSSSGPRGRSKASQDIKLPRGVAIRGKVTEQGTGRPLAGVEHPVHPGPRAATHRLGLAAIVASRDDGSFQIAVPPGKGHLLVFGPTPTTSSARSASTGCTRIGPAGHAAAPTRSSPTRSRPATRRTRSPRRCGRA